MEICGLSPGSPLYQTIPAALRGGRFPHAVLLEGGTAQQRLTLGEWLAAALVCSADSGGNLFGETEKPCGECSDCVKAAVHSHPDIALFSGGETANSFHAQDVRSIRTQAYILPNEAARKVFLLEHIQTMSVTAQNALLKVLEEPPDSVCFLLLCSSKNVMLQTILSRCTVFNLGAVQAAEPDDSLREPLSAIVRALCGTSEFALLAACAPCVKDKTLFRALLPALSETLRDALLLRAGAAVANSAIAKPLCAHFSDGQLLRAVDLLRALSACADRNENHNLLTARLCSCLWQVQEI